MPVMKNVSCASRSARKHWVGYLDVGTTDFGLFFFPHLIPSIKW